MQNHSGRDSKNLHIAHRRSPSELTPLMMEQLALQQQMEMLQVQQQQILAQQQQFAQIGLLSSPNMQSTPVMGNVSTYSTSPNPSFGSFSSSGGAAGHRRTQSSVPSYQLAPGGNGSVYDNGGTQQPSGRGGNRTVGSQGGGPGTSNSGVSGHTRRHSLALPEAKRAAAQLAQAQKQQHTSGVSSVSGVSSGSQNNSGYQFPPKSSGTDGFTGSKGRHGHSRSHGGPIDFASEDRSRSPHMQSVSNFSFPSQSGYSDNSYGSHDRRMSSSNGHTRSGSRSYDNDWRRNSMQFPPQQTSGQQLDVPNVGNQHNFVPGHRSRSSINNNAGSSFSSGSFQSGIIPVFSQQQFNVATSGGHQNRMSIPMSSHDFVQPQMPLPNQQNSNQIQSQQRKSLFLPYLPQASVPGLVSEGRLVTGILRVNKKNRSDAYVSTDGLLDADIYICGSKDRNRALEGDVVAVELLTVDEVWGSKREKEEKKKRKDGEESNASGLQRRGSLRTRPLQKKNDDVEVEGQGLLLVEEDEISDEKKPLYAGHVVAVLERTPGQVYSGTLGLLRPSSQAAKEKQEMEKRERGDNPESTKVDKPKIVWFKPTDKRVPLIAIPTEQAPRDFVENHEKYVNTLFVASIKRWPITSLHPFGMLIESLGTVGDHDVEINAILRDNNFLNDAFSDSVLNAVSSVPKISENTEERRSFMDETIYSLDIASSAAVDQAIHIQDISGQKVRVGVHIADVSTFVLPNSPLDREAKARGTSVFMADKTVPMLPKKLTDETISLIPGKESLAFSVLFDVNIESFEISNLWVGKSIVKPTKKLSSEEILKILDPNVDSESETKVTEAVSNQHPASELVNIMKIVAEGFRRRRLNSSRSDIPHLHLLNQLEDENVPIETNILERKASSPIVDEIMIKVNSIVANILAQRLGDRAFLRKQTSPGAQRINDFVEKMHCLGYDFDVSSSAKLQNGLFSMDNTEILKGLETLLLKAFSRAKYFVAGKAEKNDQAHYLLNLPVYTHFTSPLRRYADIIVHRQLASVLTNTEYTVDVDTLTKIADHCNDRKDSAKNAQDQSIHLFLCEVISNLSSSTGQLIRDAIVINVYESAFDVLIPKFGIEKRVHCDQLPLDKAEFYKKSRLLELYWEKGVDSATYIPDDERDKADYGNRVSSITAAVVQDKEEKVQKINSSITANKDESAIVNSEDADKDVVSSTVQSKSLPPSPTKRSPSRDSDKPQRTASMTKINSLDNDISSSSPLDAYLGDVVTRVNGSQYIQDIRELQHVPILIHAEIGKSLPCLTVRTLNPFAS
ncbi:hypothetical protein V1511DRAFT_520944 [Dipodascopsis uninucleata]